MIRAWRQRRACRSKDSPGPWLRQIARNEALRLVQRDLAHPLERLDGENEQRDVGSDGLEERAVRRLSVDQALAQLTEEDRQLVQLRYRLDLSQVAIAEALGIAEATVRVRLHRIRKRLRALMGEHA